MKSTDNSAAPGDSEIHPADRLRTPENIYAPDLRNAPGLAVAKVQEVPAELRARLSDLAQFVLDERVPERVRIHFETAKNLYAYSWFVYRFHMVAQQQALVTLELALRIRFYPPDGIADDRRATLRPMLKRAVSEGLLLPKSFSVVQRRAMQAARNRTTLEVVKRMTGLGLDSIEIDEEGIAPLEQDYPADWLENWVASVPELRNMHAHGTWSLWPTVLGTFEQVAEALNQLWKEGG